VREKNCGKSRSRAFYPQENEKNRGGITRGEGRSEKRHVPSHIWDVALRNPVLPQKNGKKPPRDKRAEEDGREETTQLRIAPTPDCQKGRRSASDHEKGGRSINAWLKGEGEPDTTLRGG